MNSDGGELITEATDTNGRDVAGWLERMPVGAGYFVRDTLGCHPLLMNHALGEMLGMDVERLARSLDMGLDGIVPTEDSARIRLILYKAGVTGGNYRVTGHVRREEGEPRTLDIWLSSEPRGDGSSLFCLVCTDATFQASSARKLEGSYERLLDVVDSIPGGIVVLDTINGRGPATLFMSNGMSKLLGGTHDQVLDLYRDNFMAGVHPGDREAVTRTIEDAVRNLGDFQMSLRLGTVMGSYVWVAASGSVEAAENHRMVYLSVTNASAEHETQIILKSVLDSFSRHEYRYICFVDGRSGAFRLLSAAHDVMVDVPNEGTNFDEAMATLIEQYVPEDEREQLEQAFKLDHICHELEDREDLELYYHVESPNDGTLYRKSWLSWIDRDKRTLALVTSDHTAEHRVDEDRRAALASALRAAEQASVAKGEFLSRMSHDIRTPLNAIIGFTQMSLDDASVGGEERERLEKVAASSHFLLSLVNDVLDMSRIESGKLSLNEHAFSPEEMVAGISAIVAPQCQDQGIAFEVHLDDALRTTFEGDSLKLQQVLVNLLGNAVKFTPAGGTVFLDLEEGARDSRHVILTCHVDDTGCGISPEFVPHLYEAFAQEHRAPSSERKGSGLGLAICHSLVAMMNGTMRVESEVGRGTRFSVEIPLRRCVPLAEEKSPLRDATPASDGIPVRGEASTCDAAPSRIGTSQDTASPLRGLRVLLAEDNEMNLEIARYLLEKDGLVVEPVVNGRLALDAFVASSVGHYAAILTDIVMPELGGRELAKSIRALDRADASTVPIIALSADAFDEDVQTSLICGITAYVVKPIDAALLRTTLRRCLPTSR